MNSRIALRFSYLRNRQGRHFLRSSKPSNPRSSSWRFYFPPSRFLRRPFESSYPHLQSSISTPTAILIAVATASTYAFFITLRFDQSKQDPLDPELRSLREEEEYAIMTGSPPPGRPGNLTPEQEKKLQEFWVAVLRVFGVPELSNGTGTVSEGAAALGEVEKRSRGDSPGSDKQKKKRISFFGRRHHDDASGDEENAADGVDKYGQTKDFHKVLENQTPEELRSAFWDMVKHDNPDGLLLRFLRARKWNVQNALIMLVATMHWRHQEMHVDDDVIRRGEGGALLDSASSTASVKKEGEDFLAQMRMGKSFLHGTDKEGRPICFVRVRLHRAGEQTEASLERYTVYTIETARLLLTSNVDTAAILFDMTDFAMANMDYAPVRFMIKVFEANYPESLGVVLVHKAPWIFQSIWKIIKGWLDPVVAAKVHFTKSLEDLKEFVPADHIAKELGGDDPWEYKYIEGDPAQEDELLKDEATRQRLLDERKGVVKEYETLTRQWIHEPKKEGLAAKRDEVAESLRKGYWELDPYLRARTLYDRTGVIGKGGRIEFYPSVNGDSKQDGPIPAGHDADGVE